MPAARVLVVVGVVAVIGWLNLECGRRFPPVRDGSPEDFWRSTADVSLPDGKDQFGRFDPVEPENAIGFEKQGFHGIHLFRADRAQVEALLPTVLAELRAQPDPQPIEGGEGPPRPNWWRDQARVSTDDITVEAFLAAASRRKRDWWREHEAEMVEYLDHRDQSLAMLSQRSRMFPASLAFEFVWLAGTFVFAALPWMRGSGRRAWAMHLGLTPLLLLLPFHCGYAVLTFTSAGPGAHGLYPVVLLLFRGLPWTRADTIIVGALPQVFAPLSQTPVGMMAISGGGSPGPIMATVLGLGIAGAVLVIGALADRRKRRSTTT